MFRGTQASARLANLFAFVSATLVATVSIGFLVTNEAGSDFAEDGTDEAAGESASTPESTFLIVAAKARMGSGLDPLGSSVEHFVVSVSPSTGGRAIDLMRSYLEVDSGGRSTRTGLRDAGVEKALTITAVRDADGSMQEGSLGATDLADLTLQMQGGGLTFARGDVLTLTMENADGVATSRAFRIPLGALPGTEASLDDT